VDAERPPREDHSLQCGDRDQCREHPQDGLGRGGPQAQQHIGDDRLGSFGDAADEVERTVVVECAASSFGQRRPGEEGRAGDVVGGQERHRRQASVGLRIRDAEHEPGVHGEVRGDIDERATVRRTGAARDDTVEPVEQPVRQPQTERDVAKVGGDRDARTEADRETGSGHGPGSQPGARGAIPQRAQRSIRHRPEPSIEHADHTSRRRTGVPLGLVPALTVLILLFGGALVGLVLGSLRPGAITGGNLGIGDWRALLTDADFHAAFRFTIIVAIASTAISAFVAVAAAGALQHRAPWLRGALASAVPLPHLVAASLAVTWLAPGGLAERLVAVLPVQVVGDSRGAGIVLVYVYKEAPFLALLVLAAWDQHTRDLEEAARSLGAGRVARLRDAILPRIAAPLLAGSLVVAAFTLGATEVPLLVGPTEPDTIATYSLTTIRIDGPVARAQASAALVVVSAMSMSLGLVAAMLHRRRRAER
jgi:putative spermidine/putrescine transport system permease protein